MIHNVIAHGQGGSLISGHPESWLDGMSLENVKLFLSTDPNAPYELTTHGLDFRWAKNLKLKDVEVNWEKPVADKWESALSFEERQRTYGRRILRPPGVARTRRTRRGIQ